MAVGKASDFVIYDEEFYAGANESLQQVSDVFNEASGGVIRLTPKMLKGDYAKEAFLKLLANNVGHRDTGSVAAQTPQPMTMGEFISVKVARKIPEVRQTLDSWKKIGYGTDEFSFQLGKQIGPGIAVDYVNTAVGVAVNAALATAGNFVAATAADPEYEDLADLFQLFGDRGMRIKTIVMHSMTHTKLLKKAIANKITDVASVAIYEGSTGTLNRRVIVTDSPALFVAGAPDTYRMLGLVEDGIVIEESEERTTLSELVGGNENIEARFQGEYAFNIGLKGMKWDTGSGANPADAALFTGANWLKAVTDVKDTFGAAITTN